MSGVCLRRSLIVLCFIQLLATTERLVFDFLAHLWLPIVLDFVELLALIFALFGAHQLHISYLVTFCSWSVLWLIWNCFLVGFYAQLSSLQPLEELMSFYTGAVSYWESGGAGCQPIFLNNVTSTTSGAGFAARPTDPYRVRRPDRVDGCWLSFRQVELLHAAAQLLLTVLALTLALVVVLSELRRRRSGGEFGAGKSKSHSLAPSFHIEYRPHRTASPDSQLAATAASAVATAAPPMTPRKIKRRSMARDSYRSSVRSTRSARHHRGSHGGSQRRRPHSAGGSYRRQRHVNPVAQLMDTSSSDVPISGGGGGGGCINPTFRSSGEWALPLPATAAAAASGNPARPMSVHSSYSNYHGQRRLPPMTAAVVAVSPSDYGTTGTLSNASSLLDHRVAAHRALPAPTAGGWARGGYSGGGGMMGPPPYSSTPSLNETAM